MIRSAAGSLILIFFVSCSSPQTPELLPVTTSTVSLPSPTPSPVPPTLTPYPLPLSPSPIPLSPTPIPCDPLTADYCITNGHFLLQRPIHPPANTSVDPSYRYASTASGKRDPHTGVEFQNKFGTAVHAAGAGTVIFAGPDERPVYSRWPDYYGNLVVIDHGGELYTLYAHLSKIQVEQGQAVAAGEQIGEVGQTGVAIGPHLHFEVRRGEGEDESNTQNPELWLVPNVGETGFPLGALQLTVLDQAQDLVKQAKFMLEHHLDKNLSGDVVFYELTYNGKMLKGEENAGIGDLPPGWYRIVLSYNGNRYERWLEVQSGKLTQAVIVVK